MLTIGLLTNNVLSANFGVNALSLSNLLLIEQSCKKNNIEHQYLLFGDVSQEKELLKEIKAVPELETTKISVVPEIELRKTSSIVKFTKNINKCDVVFDTSGGDSYSDIYGNKRMLHQYFPKWITLMCRKPLVLTPQTIGPFKSKIWNELSKKQLKKCLAVFARDEASFEVAYNEFGLRNVTQVTDMAMILPYKKYPLPEKGKLKVGVNVSGLLYNGGYTQNNQFSLKSSYRELVNRMIVMLTEELDCEVFLVPHVITTGTESDNEACEEIKRNYPKVNYQGPFKNAIEAKSFISSLDMLIGSRMHTTIASISAHVPTIPLSYSRKFEGLFGSLKYNVCINLKEDSQEVTLDKICSYVNNISDLKKNVQDSNEVISKKIDLYKVSLTSILEKCNG